MAIAFVNNIAFSGGAQSQSLRLENLASDPGSGYEGQLYFNTATDRVRVYANSAWTDVDGANDFLTGLSFNTTDGVLTATVQNQSDVTVDLDGRYALAADIPSNIVQTISASSGTFVSLTDAAGATGNVDLGTFNLSATGTPSSLTFLRGDNTWATPVDNDNYVDSISFSGGILTLGRTGALADLTQDLDGRYLELTGGTMSGSIAMGSNSITGLANPTNDQDAATKAYVDGLVEGGLTFKDGFNATTGAIDGGGNLTSGATRVAVSVGDYYVVTTAGDFYGDSNYPLTVGDSVIAKADAVVGASTVADWVVVQGDEGVVDITSGNGAASTGNAITSNTNARGSVTIESFAYDGGTNVGHVPSGGSATTFLRGDGGWVTPTDTQPNDTTITLSAGTGLSGGGDFTLNQATPETITFNSAAKRLDLNSAVAGIARAEAGGITTFTIDVTDANVFGTGAAALDVMVEVVGNAENAGDTVYAETGRSVGNITVKFIGSVANGDYQVLLNYIG